MKNGLQGGGGDHTITSAPWNVDGKTFIHNDGDKYLQHHMPFWSTSRMSSITNFIS
jgi:hypothetical protein